MSNSKLQTQLESKDMEIDQLVNEKEINEVDRTVIDNLYSKNEEL